MSMKISHDTTIIDLDIGATTTVLTTFDRQTFFVSKMKFLYFLSWGQCYKYFYRSNLPPFHGNTAILCLKTILPWKLLWEGSKLPWYFNPRKSRVNITTVIYHGIVL